MVFSLISELSQTEVTDDTEHKHCLSRLCRICAGRSQTQIQRQNKVKPKKCSDHSSKIMRAFDLDITNDEDDIHPVVGILLKKWVLISFDSDEISALGTCLWQITAIGYQLDIVNCAVSAGHTWDFLKCCVIFPRAAPLGNMTRFKKIPRVSCR